MPVKTDEHGGCPAVTEADAATSQGMPWSEGHHWKLGGSGEDFSSTGFRESMAG